MGAFYRPTNLMVDMQRKELESIRLRSHIIIEDDDVLVVENLKYHEQDYPHYTLFSKNYGMYAAYDPEYMKEMSKLFVKIFFLGWADWHIYQNSSRDRTSKLLHIHVVKDIRHYLQTYFIPQELASAKQEKTCYKCGGNDLRRGKWGLVCESCSELQK